MNTRIAVGLAVVAAGLFALWYFLRGGGIGASAGSGYTGSPGLPLDIGPVAPGGFALGLDMKAGLMSGALVDSGNVTSGGLVRLADLPGTKGTGYIVPRTTGLSSMGSQARRFLGI